MAAKTFDAAAYSVAERWAAVLVRRPSADAINPVLAIQGSASGIWLQ